MCTSMLLKPEIKNNKGLNVKYTQSEMCMDEQKIKNNYEYILEMIVMFSVC